MVCELDLNPFFFFKKQLKQLSSCNEPRGMLIGSYRFTHCL